jgi:hypothetical protein
MGVAEMATAAVALLAPYVAKGGEELAKKVGGEVGTRVVELWDLVKGKLTSPAAKEAVADLEAKPEDERRQGALSVQLEKALEADPAFRDQVAGLLREMEQKGGRPITQIANIVGDRNVNTQIAGAGNTVTIGR